MRRVVGVVVVAAVAFTAGAWAQSNYQAWREGITEGVDAEWNESITKDDTARMIYNYHNRYHQDDFTPVTVAPPTTFPPTTTTTTTLSPSPLEGVPSTTTTSTTLFPPVWTPIIEYSTSDASNGNEEQGYVFRIANPLEGNSEEFKVLYYLRFYEAGGARGEGNPKFTMMASDGDYNFEVGDYQTITDFSVLRCEPIKCVFQRIGWPGPKSTTTTLAPTWEPIIELTRPIPVSWTNSYGTHFNRKYMAYRLKNQSEEETHLNIYVDYKFYSLPQEDGQIYIWTAGLKNEGCVAWLDEEAQRADGYRYNNCFGYVIDDIIEDGIRLWCEPISCKVEIVDFIDPAPSTYGVEYNFYGRS